MIKMQLSAVYYMVYLLMTAFWAKRIDSFRISGIPVARFTARMSSSILVGGRGGDDDDSDASFGQSQPPEELKLVDYTKMKPDDPLFLDMPWPEESGTQSAAFARHVQWKRRLSDGERLRWHRWAVYQRLGIKNLYQYSLEDYIYQNLISELDQRATQQLEQVDPVGRSRGRAVNPSSEKWSMTNNKLFDSTLFATMSTGFRALEEEEVQSVIRAYYSSFNRGNFDEIRSFWLPDENAELLLPGYEKARGGLAIDKLYRRMIRESKPFGSVDASVKSVQCYGYLAVVHTIETVGKGSALRVANKKKSSSGGGVSSSTNKQAPPPRLLLTTTVLRKANKQWRIMCHHAIRVSKSPYTDKQVEVKFNRAAAKSRNALVKPEEENSSHRSNGKGNNRDSYSYANSINKNSDGNRSKDSSQQQQSVIFDQVQQLLREATGESSSSSSSSSFERENNDGVIVIEDGELIEDSSRNNNMSRGKKSLTGDNEGVIVIEQEESEEEAKAQADDDDYSGMEEFAGYRAFSLKSGDTFVGGRDVSSRDKDEIDPFAVGLERGRLQQEGNKNDYNSRSNKNAAVTRSSSSSSPNSDRVIDETKVVSKQAIQALRFLHRSGRLSKSDKEILIADIIAHLAADQDTSLVEIAFEMLYSYRQRDIRSGASSSTPYNDRGQTDYEFYSTGLADFADQCDLLLEQFRQRDATTTATATTSSATVIAAAAADSSSSSSSSEAILDSMSGDVIVADASTGPTGRGPTTVLSPPADELAELDIPPPVPGVTGVTGTAAAGEQQQREEDAFDALLEEDLSVIGDDDDDEDEDDEEKDEGNRNLEEDSDFY